MSLSDRLNSAINTPPSRKCKLMIILDSDKLTDEDRKTFISLLNVPEGNPSRVSNVILAQVLRDEGFDLSDSAVDRHRRRSCSCSRNLGE
jgi:hypothetical protein